MKILLVHGIGHSDAEPNYYKSWIATITEGLERGGLTKVPEYVPFHYDDLFDALPRAGRVCGGAGGITCHRDVALDQRSDQ